MTEPSPTERFRQSLLAPTASGRFRQQRAATKLQRTLMVVSVAAAGLLILSLRMTACGDAGAGDLREAHRHLCLVATDEGALEAARASARRAARAQPGETYRVFVYQVSHSPAPGAPVSTDAAVIEHLHAGDWAAARSALAHPDVHQGMPPGRVDLWVRLLSKLEWMHASGCTEPVGDGPPPPAS